MRKSAVILVLLTTFLAYRPTTGQDYEVSVTNVNVWVKVVDSAGKPVQGIRKDEFEIFEDGKKMSSECFEEIGFNPIDTSIASSPGTSIALPIVVRRFVLFLDLYNTTHVEFERI